MVGHSRLTSHCEPGFTYRRAGSSPSSSVLESASLMPLAGQQRVAQVLGSLPPMRETQKDFLIPASAWASPSHRAEQTSRWKIHEPLSPALPPTIFQTLNTRRPRKPTYKLGCDDFFFLRNSIRFVLLINERIDKLDILRSKAFCCVRDTDGTSCTQAAPNCCPKPLQLQP